MTASKNQPPRPWYWRQAADQQPFARACRNSAHFFACAPLSRQNRKTFPASATAASRQEVRSPTWS